MNDNTKIIEVVGVHQRVEGYPNVLFLLDGLESSGSFEYEEYNIPIWSGNLSVKKNFFVKSINILKALHAHLRVFYFFLSSDKLERVYIPYPSIFIAASLTLLPKRKKPNFLVIDAFISIYDTVVFDRKLFLETSLVARLLKKIEMKAFRQANVVVTDTYQNSLYLSELFDLPIDKFRNIPLSTDEVNFNSTVSKSRNKGFEVVFIGTLIPLHGIETILEAIKLLAGNKAIKFTIVGDGQMSGLIEDDIEVGATNIRWIQQWQSSEELSNMLSEASVCLGIFGTGDKTQRVCPFKLYAYMACGLPVISGSTRWSTQAMKEIEYLPLMTVPVGNAGELASAITQCYKSESFCTELAANSYRYYNEILANKNVVKQFEGIFK